VTTATGARVSRICCRTPASAKPIVTTAHISIKTAALEFPDGQIVPLTVVEGQEASVLQLPAQPATAAEAKAQERVAHVG
jgi:hypothetical protein